MKCEGFKKMFNNFCAAVVILSAFFCTSSFAQSTTGTQAAQPAATAPADTQKTVTIADAQKAYVAGNWRQAAAAYEVVCPNEPDSVRTECYLWNVLALSQIGSAKDFSKAGKRLDSLINKTNPQKAVYADLMMTKAQFQLYMGRNEKAAEALIHAIETSQPHQAIVLKKVCHVIQSKVKNTTLDETCKRLDEPIQPPVATPVETVKTPEPETTKQTDSSKTTKPESTPKEQPSAKQDSSNKATPALEVQPASSSAKAPEQTPETSSSAKSNDHWILQLGAFSLKSNADLLIKNLKKQGIVGTIEERVGETKTLYLVQTGNFDSREKANDFGASKLAPLNVEFKAILKK